MGSPELEWEIDLKLEVFLSVLRAILGKSITT